MLYNHFCLLKLKANHLGLMRCFCFSDNSTSIISSKYSFYIFLILFSLVHESKENLYLKLINSTLGLSKLKANYLNIYTFNQLEML